MGCCNECDDLGLATGQIGPQGPAGPSGITTLLLGAQNIFISKDGYTAAAGATNRDLTKSFSSPTEAIVKASALAPSASNIINLIMYPGTYTEDIAIPQYCNLITVTPNELIFNQAGYPVVATKSANALRPVYVNGTITVASDNVNIVGVNCNTLAVNTTGTNCSFNHMVVSTAITTNIGQVVGGFYDVHSSAFFSGGMELAGYFEKCTGDDNSFASSELSNGGTISGIMIDCIGDSVCFASSNQDNAGDITGKLIRCIGNDAVCFASSDAGNAGTISGILEYCIDIGGISFASSATLSGGTLDGTFIGCRSEGDKSFGFGDEGGILSGNFIDCIGGGNSFGCFITDGSTLSGKFINCVDTVASVFSFGSTGVGTGALLSGTFTNCTIYGVGFGVAAGGEAAILSGKFINCTAYTTDYCFASSSGGTAGQISGILTNCKGGGHAFCSSDTTGGTVTSQGQLINCTSVGDIMLRKAVVSGKIIGARVNNTNAAEDAVIVDEGAILRYCDFKPGAGGISVSASTPIEIAMVHCNLYGGGTNNITNLVNTPYCTDDADDLF